jgi:hypothetical protein
MSLNVVVVLQNGTVVKGRPLERVGELGSIRGRKFTLVHATVTAGTRLESVERITIDGSSVQALGSTGH